MDGWRDLDASLVSRVGRDVKRLSLEVDSKCWSGCPREREVCFGTQDDRDKGRSGVEGKPDERLAIWVWMNDGCEDDVWMCIVAVEDVG